MERLSVEEMARKKLKEAERANDSFLELEIGNSFDFNEAECQIRLM